MSKEESQDKMNKLVSLCKRRGFVFQSSEIYGGLRSCYDYGPLGVELKRNIAQRWWRSMIYERDDIVGIDASILMHTDVWRASGHLDNFNDPLVDCLNCQERFRADKAPVVEPGTAVEYRKGGKKNGEVRRGIAERSYVCPNCSSIELSVERQFCGMFRTHMGAVDSLADVIGALEAGTLDPKTAAAKLRAAQEQSAVYLRPETAQAMFVQFANVQQSMSAKVPFGIAQIGKSFRNEIIVEHFIFRSCEFEQMEMEFFVEPGTQREWLEHWTQERLNWHRELANYPERFRLRQHREDERAHYSDNCWDVEYEYPWGWDELEGIASRTDYDLKKHSGASGSKLSYFDQQKNDPATGKPGWRYTPYVIEPAAGLTRLVLCALADAYHEEAGESADGEAKYRTVLKLHPSLAPYKVAILPLVRKEGMPEIGQKLAATLRKAAIHASFDDVSSIGKRYARHDEIGTPYCATIDQQTLTDQTVTLRNRDTTQQVRVGLDHVQEWLEKSLK